jgi:hypothetical protein
MQKPPLPGGFFVIDTAEQSSQHMDTQDMEKPGCKLIVML